MPITVDDAGPSAYARVSTHGLTPRALGVPEGHLRPPRQGSSRSAQRRQLNAPGNTLYVAVAGAHLAAEVVVVVHASCSYPQWLVTKLPLEHSRLARCFAPSELPWAEPPLVHPTIPYTSNSPSPPSAFPGPGVDNATCGFSPATPCASIPYAVNGIGPYVLPATSMLTVIVGPGLYGATSCGAYGLRPLNITGAGSGATIIDCAGTNRMLFAFSVTFVSGLTVRRGLAVVTGSGSNGVAVDGGGAIAILWSAANTPPGGRQILLLFESLPCAMDVRVRFVCSVLTPVPAVAPRGVGHFQTVLLMLRTCVFCRCGRGSHQ
jgi:hypothetical protein